MKNFSLNKNIVFLSSSFYPSVGGVEKHVKNVSEVLAKKRHNITVLVRYKKGYPKYQSIGSILVYRMPKRDYRPFLNIWYLKNKKLFKDAVIHSHDYFPFSLRRILKGHTWVHTFHGYEGYPLDPLAIASRKQVSNSVDYTFCVGKFIEKWYGTKCNEVIWGAAEKPKSINKDIKYDFIFYGRFEEDTGFEKYIRAFKIIKSTKPKAKMLVVGWGSRHDWAVSYSKKYDLGIEFRSPVSNIYPSLAQAKIAFVSGYQAIIESGLMKKSIVAYYDTPIKKDYLEMHPLASSLNIVNSIDGISQKALDLMNNSDYKTKKIYNWSVKQSWSYIVKRYEKSYKS